MQEMGYVRDSTVRVEHSCAYTILDLLDGGGNKLLAG